MSRRVNPGTALVNSIMEYLAVLRIPAYRINSGFHVVREPGKKERAFSFGEKGMADILASPRLPVPLPDPIKLPDQALHYQHGLTMVVPCFLWIECKYGSGRQSREQKEFEQRSIGADHYYVVVGSIDELRDWLHEHKAQV